MEFHGSSGSTANYHGPVTNINTIHKGSNGTRTGPQGAANQKSNLQKLNWPAPLRILEQKKISGTSFDEISLPSRPSRLAKRRSATTAILWGGNDNAEKDVFWLSGYTGSGKSIIARTVAEHFHREKRLAASFFCGSRAETLIMEDIIPTMAYQIAREFEGTRSHLAKVLTGPSALDKDINILWDILIAEPLRSLKLGRLVMVIDGLDQCESIKHQTNLLDCLVSKSLQSNSPIKLFVSCKPTQHLRQILDGYALPATCRAVLCDCDEDRREIRSFLEDSLKGIADSRQKERTMREVRGQWPTEVALLCLAEMASGQFLFADAVVTFVSDEHYDPDDRLKAVLENISVVLNDMGINKVYRAVLKQAIARGLPENQQLLHSLLVHLLFHEYPPYQPLRLSDLALFWTIESPQAVRVLAPLRMELLVPPMGDPTGVIRFRHKSFVRYLSQLYSFSPGPLVVNAVHSGPIVRRCFQIMHGDHKTLEPDKTREIMEFAFRQSLDYCGSSIPTMHTIYNLVTLDMVLWREAWSTLPWTPCDSGYMRFQAWLEKQRFLRFLSARFPPLQLVGFRYRWLQNHYNKDLQNYLRNDLPSLCEESSLNFQRCVTIVSKIHKSALHTHTIPGTDISLPWVPPDLRELSSCDLAELPEQYHRRSGSDLWVELQQLHAPTLSFWLKQQLKSLFHFLILLFGLGYYYIAFERRDMIDADDKWSNFAGPGTFINPYRLGRIFWQRSKSNQARES